MLAPKSDWPLAEQAHGFQIQWGNASAPEIERFETRWSFSIRLSLCKTKMRFPESSCLSSLNPLGSCFKIEKY